MRSMLPAQFGENGWFSPYKFYLNEPREIFIPQATLRCPLEKKSNQKNHGLHSRTGAQGTNATFRTCDVPHKSVKRTSGKGILGRIGFAMSPVRSPDARLVRALAGRRFARGQSWRPFYGGREGFRIPDPCRVKPSRNRKKFNKINDKLVLKLEK